ncbi:hypothetical protein AYO47_07510 [Planctomyces sp. SCGC AG-212-M04]|nr:hypothetical protein AYO47_07510 [Planctomyces sp. SCGC AG-212-M04]
MPILIDASRGERKKLIVSRSVEAHVVRRPRTTFFQLTSIDVTTSAGRVPAIRTYRADANDWDTLTFSSERAVIDFAVAELAMPELLVGEDL